MIGLFLLVMARVSRADEIHYCFPVQPIDKMTFSKGGHRYPAVDIFGKTGMSFVAPVSGVVEYLNRNDEWDKETNDPDKKGGRWVSLIGDDGLRYYGSHLERVYDKIGVGQRIKSGDVLGYLGDSGNAKGTPVHLHFGMSHASTPCSWKTRRGEIEPYLFLRCILRRGCNVEAVLAKEKARVSGIRTGRHQSMNGCPTIPSGGRLAAVTDFWR